MRYYLKRCGFQELGSVTNGKPQRGRYLMTSMNGDVLSLFPSLSETQLNDSALIPFIPLYLGKKVYCNYVYHNDKFHGSTAKHPRNEYRIYLNRELENQTLFFEVGDIVVIRPSEPSEENENQTVYYLDLVKNDGTALYEKLNGVIDAYPIHGGYGIFDGTIPEFEEKVRKTARSDEYEVAIDDTVKNKIITAAEHMASLFNMVSFRDFVMVGYGGLCAISGAVIRYGSLTNLEAAHIKPKSHGGLYLPSNGLALCRDLHWAFDKGFFTLDDDLKVVVHPKIESEYLRSLNGRQIRIPSDSFFAPDPDNVRYHRENIYGLFLSSGKL